MAIREPGEKVEYKHGEPWKVEVGRLPTDWKILDCNGNPFFGKDKAERVQSCVNFCAGVEIPNSIGGLKELLEWVQETCQLDGQKKACIDACCPIHELGFCDLHDESAETDKFFQ